MKFSLFRARMEVPIRDFITRSEPLNPVPDESG